jgi:hypothetical protein
LLLVRTVKEVLQWLAPQDRWLRCPFTDWWEVVLRGLEPSVVLGSGTDEVFNLDPEGRYQPSPKGILLTFEGRDPLLLP